MNQGAWRGTTWPGWNDMLFFVCHDSLQGSRTQGKKLEMMGRYFFDRPFHPQPKWSNWWFGYRSLTFGTSGELTDREHHRVKTFIFWLLYYIILFIYIIYILYIYYIYIIYILYIYIIYIYNYLFSRGGPYLSHHIPLQIGESDPIARSPQVPIVNILDTKRQGIHRGLGSQGFAESGSGSPKK